MSKCIYEIINFPKYHRKNLIDFCPERLFILGMLCTHLSRVALRIIKTNYMYLVYKTFQGRNFQNLYEVYVESVILNPRASFFNKWVAGNAYIFFFRAEVVQVFS